MYYGSEIFYGFETMMTIAVSLDSPFNGKKYVILDIKCTIIGKLTDNMFFFSI